MNARHAANAIRPRYQKPYKEPVQATGTVPEAQQNSFDLNKMAPSATETISLPTRPVEHTQVKLTSSTGPYKELAPIGYEKEAEEQGKDGFQAAKVCEFDDIGSTNAKPAISTGTIFPPGAVRNIRHLSPLSTTTLASMQTQVTLSSLQKVLLPMTLLLRLAPKSLVFN